MLLKIVILILIMNAFKWIFSMFYRIGMEQVLDSYCYEDTETWQLILKAISWFLIFVFFLIVFTWKYIDLSSMIMWQKGIVSCIWLYLLMYYRGSMGLLHHVINLMYYPQLTEETEYISMFGDIRTENNRFILSQDALKKEIDITDILKAKR